MPRLLPALATAPLLLFAGCGGDDFAAAGLHTRVKTVLERKEDAPVKRVILITCDTLRADHVGCFGGPEGLTPELDALAAESTIYPRAFSTSATTVPSMSSLFTGHLPVDLGVAGGNRYLIDEGVDTVTEHLAHAGILTGGVISNFVLVRPALSKGYHGPAQGFRFFDDEMKTKELNRPHFEKIGPDTTAGAKEWLDQLGEEERDEFFLWVHYMDPHGPYTPPEGTKDDWESTVDVSKLPRGTSHSGRGQMPLYQILEGNIPLADYHRLYQAEVHAMDAAIGDLMEYLEREDLLEDTLLIFTADHGEALGEEDYWFCHGESVIPSMVQVPMIVRWPGQGPGTSDRLVSLTDMHPTILEAFGFVPPETDGVSLFSDKGRDYARQELVSSMGGDPWLGITDGEFHWVQTEGHGMLFDLDQPDRDVKADHPDRVAALKAAMDRPRHELPTPYAIDVSHENQDALSALGYTGGDEDDETDD